MKRKLLKVPPGDDEVLLLPEAASLYSFRGDTVALAHQPHFFNPGIALKFLFLERIPARKKIFIVVDTDRVVLQAAVPAGGGSIRKQDFIVTGETFYDYPAPSQEEWISFFLSLKREVRRTLPESADSLLENLSRYEEYVLAHKAPLLKTVLSDSFFFYSGIDADYCFLSDILKEESYLAFFLKIYKESRSFCSLFNTILDEYRMQFRFRYKSYPFPRLTEGEMPFWTLEDGARSRLFEDAVDLSRVPAHMLFPRAAALMLYLRLYVTDIFIHGIGGANYEWVIEQLAERFFDRKITPPVVASGTYFAEGTQSREFPFFFYPSQRLIRSLERRLGEYTKTAA